LKSEISYGKLLRAHQKFSSLNKTLINHVSEVGSGGIFNLT